MALALFLLLLGFSDLATAYFGPGLAAGTLATVLGFVGGILLLIFGSIWYPLKRLYLKLRTSKPAKTQAPQEP